MIIQKIIWPDFYEIELAFTEYITHKMKKKKQIFCFIRKLSKLNKCINLNCNMVHIYDLRSSMLVMTQRVSSED